MRDSDRARGGPSPDRAEWITGVDDPRIRDYTNLTDVNLRRKKEPAEGLFMAESERVIERAVAAGYRPRSLLAEEKWADRAARIGEQTGAQVFIAESAVLEAITGYRVHRGLLAAVDRRPLPDPATLIRDARRIVVLAGLVDHTNVGAAFRSVAAMGMDAVLVTSDGADPLYRRSVRVSMGTVFQVPWTVVEARSLSDLLADHTTVALTPADDAESLPELVPTLSGPVALIVGSEGPGLTDGLLRAADHRAAISMAGGVDSLNVAAAVAVACYIVARGHPA